MKLSQLLGACVSILPIVLMTSMVYAAEIHNESPTRPGPTVCTMQYDPVCAEQQVQCIKAPCPPIQQTYGNACMANGQGATILYEGECSEPVGADSDEHGCKASAGYSRNSLLQACLRPRETESNLIKRAYDLGLTRYNTAKSFMPQARITREQVAKMLMTLIERAQVKEWMVKQPAGACEWKDQSSLDPTLKSAVELSCKKGLFQGSAEGYFFPHRALTKEHGEYLLQRLSNYIPVLHPYKSLLEAVPERAFTRIEFVQVLHQIFSIIGPSEYYTQASDELNGAKKRWEAQQMLNYTLTQQQSCFCPEDYRRPVRFQVKSGVALPESAHYNDGQHESLPKTIALKLYTVEDAFDLIQKAIDERVERLEVTYDKQYGYPSSISIDVSSQIADEEQYLSFALTL